MTEQAGSAQISLLIKDLQRYRKKHLENILTAIKAQRTEFEEAVKTRLSDEASNFYQCFLVDATQEQREDLCFSMRTLFEEGHADGPMMFFHGVQ